MKENKITQVRTFHEMDIKHIEFGINDFLNSEIELVDIKYCHCENENSVYFSAIVIYRT